MLRCRRPICEPLERRALLAADPAFQSITVQPPGPILTGSQSEFVISYTASSSVFRYKLRLFLSSDTTAGNADDILIYTHLPLLTPTSPLSVFAQIPTSVPAGDYHVVGAFTDSFNPTTFLGDPLHLDRGPMPDFRPVPGQSEPLTRPLLTRNAATSLPLTIENLGDKYGIVYADVYSSPTPTLQPNATPDRTVFHTLSAHSSLSDSIQFTLPHTTGTVYPIVVLRSLDLETDLTNNVAVFPPVTMTAPVADLTITALDVEPYVHPGATLAVFPTVVATHVPDPDYFGRTNYYLTSDDSIGNGDDIEVFRVFNDPTRVTIPANLPLGTYRIAAVVDRNNDVYETDETNNTLLSDPFAVTRPDLAVLPPTFSIGPAGPVAHAHLTNTTGLPASASNQVRLYLSPDAAYSNDDLARPLTGAAPADINEPLGSRTLNLTPEAYPITPGNYYVVAVLTPGYDNDPTNNVAVSADPITVLPAGVAAVEFSGTDTTGATGTAFATHAVYSYVGYAPGTYLPAKTYLIDQNGNESVYSTWSIVTTVDTRFAPASPGLGTYDGFTIPPIAYGTYRLRTQISSPAGYPESDTSDNSVLGPAFTVVPKRFTLTAVSAPPVIDYLEPFDLTFTALISGYFDQEFFITFGIALPDGGAVMPWFTAPGVNGSLDPVPVTFTIPYSHYGPIPFGDYPLTPSLGSGPGGILEVADSFVPPTLTVTSLGPLLQLSTPTPSSPDDSDLHPGDDATLSFTVTNTGQQTSPATSVSLWYYVTGSDSGPLPAVDVAPLAPGASRTISVTRTLPADLDPGHSYTLDATITGRAHFGDDPADQTASSNFSLSAQPASEDVPRNLWVAGPPVVSGTYQPGSTLYVTPNIGTLLTPGANVAYYLLTSPIISTAHLPSLPVAAYPYGPNDQQPHEVQIPAYLAPGVYYLALFVDHDNAVVETDETDNVYVSPPFTIDPFPEYALFSLTAPAGVTAGSALRVFPTPMVTSANSAPDTLFDFGSAFRLSLNDTYGDDDDIFLGATRFTQTGPGTGQQTQLALTVPPSTAPGTYRLLAQTRRSYPLPLGGYFFDDGSYRETSFLGPTVTVLPPSLTGSLKVSPKTLTLNSPARLNLSLTNPSNKPVTRKYHVSYYLSADPSFSPDDTLFSKHTINVSLAKKQSRSYPLTAKVPANAAIGTRYLIAVADAAGKPTPAHHLEFASKPLTLRGPLLTAAIINTDYTPTSTRLTVRVANAGTAPSSANSPITLHLFSNTNPNKPVLTIKKSPALKPGKFIDYTLAVPRTAASSFTVTLLTAP